MTRPAAVVAFLSFCFTFCFALATTARAVVRADMAARAAVLTLAAGFFATGLAAMAFFAGLALLFNIFLATLTGFFAGETGFLAGDGFFTVALVLPAGFDPIFVTFLAMSSFLTYFAAGFTIF